MSTPKSDFFVIYNRALTPKAETEDTKLSLRFTEKLVQFLEERGHKGHYAERDAIPGSNIFKVLFDKIKETKKTILVVTPEFLRNCWATYSSQAAFKELLDTSKSDKLVPISIDINDDEKLKELNIVEWIHFTCDWEPSRNAQKWNIISQIFDYAGPLSRQPAYQEYIHAQERGDNRLRTEGEAFVVQPMSLQDDSKDFLTERFLTTLGERFPADWKLLAIKLGLKDEKVKEAEVNNPANVCMQAYRALFSWKNSFVGSEQEKVSFLLTVLRDEMLRNDVADEIEDKFKEFKKQKEPNPSANEGFDEVDMGMSRKRNNVVPAGLEQTSVKQPAWSQMVIDQSQNTGSGEPQHTTYVERQLKAEKVAVIEAKLAPPPQVTSSSLDMMKLQQGPSMSLPSPYLKLQSIQSTKLPGDCENGINMLEEMKSQDSIDRNGSGEVQGAGREMNISQTENFSDIGGPKAMGHEVEEHISATNTQAQFSMQDKRTSHGKPPTQQATNESGNSAVQTTDLYLKEETKIKYKNQQSLSKDNDLTADANGSFSFNQQKIPADTSVSGKPNNLVINQRDEDIPSLGLTSLNAEDKTPDSGYSCSAAVTPHNELVSPDENKLLQTAQENVNQSEKNKRHQSVESLELTENQTSSVKYGNHGALAVSNKSAVNSTRAELDSSLSSSQGQSGGTRSLGSRISCALLNIWLKPELAYN